MSGSKRVDRDHYLFREGDPPDAMYVVKAGKFAVVKSKNNSEIVLAEIGPGAMVGEMAFFDNKPRSASVKALKDSDVIILPYKALHAQFAAMPEWTKAIMRTVNESLRNANKRIKELEKTSTEEQEVFPPHTITKLTSILNFVGLRHGKQSEEGLVIPGGILRNVTIQVFQEPTHKMQRLMSALQDLKYMKVEDLGEGRQKIVIFQPDLLFSFSEWYNEWLFKKETDRPIVREEDVRLLRAVVHFGKKQTPDEKGFVKVNLTEIQNESMKELGNLVKVDEMNALSANKIVSDQMMEPSGVHVQVELDVVERLANFWDIVYFLRKAKR